MTPKEIVHTDICKALQAERYQYAQRWPNYCHHCEGEGIRTYSFDPSPAGVSLSPGVMYDSDPCPKCLEESRCPRCAKNLLGPWWRRRRIAMELDTRALSELCYWLLRKRWFRLMDLVSGFSRAIAGPIPWDDVTPCAWCGWNPEGNDGMPQYECYCGQSAFAAEFADLYLEN